MFAAATIQWSWGLDDFGGTSMVNAGVQRVTQNIIDTFTAGAPPTGADGRRAPRRASPARRQNAAVALTWTAPASDGGAPITGYRMTPYIGGTAQPAGARPARPRRASRVTGLTNGTAYTFTVAAINAAGTGADSTASAAVTPRRVPGAPTAVAGTAGNGQVALTWTAPASNGGSAITGYRVTPFDRRRRRRRRS